MKIKEMDFINSWKSSNKKNKLNICIRLGKITLFEIFYNSKCNSENCLKFRIMLFNIGVQN